MKKLFILPLLLVPALLHAQTNVWQQRDSIKGPPKSACVAFTAYTSGFVGGGFDMTEYKRSFYRYDPAFDDWDQVTSLGDTTGGGLERSSAVAFSINNIGYVGLGQGMNPYFDDFWRYDPATDTWTQVANFGGTARTQAVGFAIDTAGYVGTGKDAIGFKKDFWRYSPATNTWTQVSDFPGTARRLAVGIAMANVAFVGTGDDGVFKNDFYKYVPATDTWTPIANFGGTARYGATGFARYPSLFVGTGYDNTLNYTNDIWEYNIWTGVWIPRAPFPSTPRANAVAFTIGTRGYMGGGFDGDPKDDFYEYMIPLAVDEENEVAGKINLFPNPANEVITLELSSNREMESVLVHDISGKQVWSGSFAKAHVQRVQLPAQMWQPGIYVCTVHCQDGKKINSTFTITR